MHSIDIALALPCISEVVVSTDDLEIAHVAQKAGASVPFLRPSALASDTAAEWLAWRHAIQYLRAMGKPIDVFLSLPPTSPLRTVEDVQCCIDAFQDTNSDMVITVREAERSPYFNMVKQNPDGYVDLAVKGEFHRRQDTPHLYDVTTVAYVGRPDFILQAERIFDGKVRAVQIPRERALDIDTQFDFLIGEALIQAQLSSRAPQLLA